LEAALVEVELGDAGAARKDVAAALQLASTRSTRILAALALARAGDLLQAQKMADELEKENPLYTTIISYWLPSVRAAIALQRKDPATAIRLLEPARYYELGGPQPAPGLGAYLYPVYLRGEAYLALGKGAEAAAEFQKYRNHLGISFNYVPGALSQLQLARATAMQGDAAKAKSQYVKFLAIWKDADPSLPALKEAKAEHAKLQAK
jgi:hypothetical protein